MMAGESRRPSGSSGALTRLKLHGSLDLAEIARLTLDALVPDLAGAAAVYAVDRLLHGGEFAPPVGGITMRRVGVRDSGEKKPVVEKTFPAAGELIAFSGQSSYARDLRAGKPLIFTRQDGPRIEQALRLSGYSTSLALPLMAEEQVAGLLSLARTDTSPAFGPADVAAVAPLAAAAGSGIANAAALLRQRAIADALQDTLLAAEPGVPPGLEAAARCVPAAGQRIGGDWYDMIPLPGGRTGLLVGDVMGHGPEAAAVMAHLRAVAQSLAQMGLEPAELLSCLDQATVMLRRPTLATCVYAVLDPEDGSCLMSAAGHPPPVLSMADGSTHVPDLPGGPSLGLGSADYKQAHLKLPSGTLIALYTDGLVESRVRPLDQGVRAMGEILGRRDGDLEAVCDTLIGSLAERHEDDVTVVLARVP